MLAAAGYVESRTARVPRTAHPDSVQIGADPTPEL